MQWEALGQDLRYEIIGRVNSALESAMVVSMSLRNHITCRDSFKTHRIELIEYSNYFTVSTLKNCL